MTAQVERAAAVGCQRQRELLAQPCQRIVPHRARVRVRASALMSRSGQRQVQRAAGHRVAAPWRGSGSARAQGPSASVRGKCCQLGDRCTRARAHRPSTRAAGGQAEEDAMRGEPALVLRAVHRRQVGDQVLDAARHQFLQRAGATDRADAVSRQSVPVRSSSARGRHRAMALPCRSSRGAGHESVACGCGAGLLSSSLTAGADRRHGQQQRRQRRDAAAILAAGVAAARSGG